MAGFRRAEYIRLFQIACELHKQSTNHLVRDRAALLADMVEDVIGQLYRPQGMREYKEPK